MKGRKTPRRSGETRVHGVQVRWPTEAHPWRHGRTVRMREAETPPPGLGFTTEMVTVSGPARSLADTVVRSSVELTNMVGRLPPFQRMLEDETKPTPVTVSMTFAEPTGARTGSRDTETGTGFRTTTGT